MATITTEGRIINLFGIDSLTNFRGGETSVSTFSTTIVNATASEYSRTVTTATTESVERVTGTNLTYNSANQPIGGQVDTLFNSFERTGEFNPGGTSLLIEEVNASVQDVLDPNYAANLLAADNTVLIENDFDGFRGNFQRLTVESGAGNDFIANTVGNKFDPAIAARVIAVNAQAGDDVVVVDAQGPQFNIALGSGADTIRVLDTPEQGAANDAVSRVVDFDPSIDRIEVNTAQNGRVFEVVDFNGNAILRTNDAAGNFEDVLVIENQPASAVVLNAIGTEAPVQPPAGGAPQFGTEGDDVLFGNPSDNVIIGLGGNDALISFEGNDALLGNEGNDSLDSGSGNDSLFGGFGNDQLFGGAGDDVLFGEDGNDVLVGDALGTAGNDTLFGGNGSDSAFGGFGDDYIEGNNGADFLFGETGNDRVFGGEGNDVAFGGSGADVVLGEGGDDVLLGETENDFLNGGLGDDSLDGGQGNDFLEGGVGNDQLFGADGDDVLVGGAGNDLLAGGAGTDFMVADGGINVMQGGTGLDIVQLNGIAGDNFWSDFENGLDRIDVSSFATLSQFGASVTVGGVTDLNVDFVSTLITVGEQRLFLEGVDVANINEDDFFFAEEPEVA